jgi:hypothetical protein
VLLEVRNKGKAEGRVTEERSGEAEGEPREGDRTGSEQEEEQQLALLLHAIGDTFLKIVGQKRDTSTLAYLYKYIPGSIDP